MTFPSRRIVASVGLVLLGLAAQVGAAAAVNSTSSASNQAASIEHRLGISSWMVGTTPSNARQVFHRAELQPLTFSIGVDLLSEHRQEFTTEAVRVTLPKGLSWGPRGPSPKTLWSRDGHWSFVPESQSCDIERTAATCKASGVPNGTSSFGWIFDVRAAAPGQYTLHAEVVPPTDGLNQVPRGKDTPAATDLIVLVGNRSGKVAASGLTLYRPPGRPSFVFASLTVRQGGLPVWGTLLICTNDFPGQRAYRGPVVFRIKPEDDSLHFALGFAQCLSGFNNKRYLGKTMTGSVELRVGETRVVRSYSVRIGPGSKLLAPHGAVVSTRRQFPTTYLRIP